MTDPSQREKLLADSLLSHFGHLPSLFCRAPGRVDLMGSHTDYNLGAVLTLPIDRDTWIAARPNLGRTVNLYSLNLNAGASFSLDARDKDPAQPWSNYVHGVAAVLQDEGYPVAGFDGVIHSTVPLRSGLSSSAALECAAATVFEALAGLPFDPVRKATLCQRAESHFVGMNCGILDQFSSCLGRESCALLLDCRDLSTEPVAIHLGIQIVICDTKAKRQLVGSEYGDRRAQCEEGARQLGVPALRSLTPATFAARQGELSPVVAKRCRFIIEENSRVFAMATALRLGDLSEIRNLARNSFTGACNLFEIDSPAMHAMMDAMLSAPGVIGARQSGAGFGGCMVAFVVAGQMAPFASAVRSRYIASTGLEPEIYSVSGGAGASSWPVRGS